MNAMPHLYGSLAVLLLMTLSLSATPQEKTYEQLYEEAKLAFYLGDFAKAKPLLVKISRANPNHRPSAIMLRQVELAEAKAAREAASLEGRMKRVRLQKFDVEGEPVAEVLEFLRVKAEQAGHAKSNFIIRLGESGTRDKLSIHLRNISVYDALKAVAESAGLRVVYDTHTVTITTPISPVTEKP